MKGQPPTKACGLCGTVAVLQRSHIVPNWVYRRVINFYPDGNTKMVVINGGIARYSIDQFAEYMLCSTCEQRFRLWESTAAELSLQKLDAAQTEVFPALQTARDITRVIYYKPDGVSKYSDMSSLDTDALARFALSVIWRAHTSREHFHNVHLGPYGEMAAAFLLNDKKAPLLPPWVSVVLHLIDPKGAPLDRIVMPPWSARSKDALHRIHSFVFFGMWFQVHVGDQMPDLIRKCCVARSRCAWVTDGAPLVNGVKILGDGVRSVGTLAREEQRRAKGTP